MEPESIIGTLRIPLYAIVTSTSEEVDALRGFTELQRKKWMKRDAAERAEILEALTWAKNNPDYPFNTLLPGLRPSKEEIYDYLCRVQLEFERLCEKGSDGAGRKNP